MQNFVTPLMNPLALGYKELYDTQKNSDALRESKKDEFFGLRDFYRYKFITSLTFNLKVFGLKLLYCT